MIKVLIVDENRLICSVLGAVLRGEEDIFVIGYATTIEEAVERADEADIILVDDALPNNGAKKITELIAINHPNVHVIITGVEKTPETILQYMEAGASGYVLKEVALADLLENIRAVHNDEGVASPEIVAKLIARVSELSQLCLDKEGVLERVETLTPREQEVLGYIRKGWSNREISEELCIEVGTVKNHVHNILDKLEVSNRHKAAELYEMHQNGDE